jgi:hypothetical protein
MKKLYILLIALTLAVAMIVPASVVNAGQTFNVSGTMKVYTPVFAVDNMVGNVMLGSETHTIIVDGSLVGTGTESVRFWYDLTAQKFHSLGLQDFTGTLNGKQGQYFGELYRIGQTAGDATVPETLTGSCHTVVKIVGGTGELANLRGTLCINLSVLFEPNDITPDNPVIWSGTYKGKLTFAKNNKIGDDEPGGWKDWKD